MYFPASSRQFITLRKRIQLKGKLYQSTNIGRISEVPPDKVKHLTN